MKTPFFSTKGRLFVRPLLTEYRTTLSNGYLGFGNDEERSEMRYVVRIAEFSESSNFRTQNALSGYSWEHASSSVELTSVPSLTLSGDRERTYCHGLFPHCVDSRGFAA